MVGPPSLICLKPADVVRGVLPTRGLPAKVVPQALSIVTKVSSRHRGVTLEMQRRLIRTINMTTPGNYSVLAKKFFDSHCIGDVLQKACLRPSRQCNH
jgi:hypothetical protein